MAKLKAAFIPLTLPPILLMTIHAIYGMFNNPLTWVGSLLVMLAIIGAFGWIAMPQVARTNEYMLPFSLAIFTGTVMTIYAYLNTETGSFFPAGYTIYGVLFWMLYLLWYSRFDRVTPGTVRVGNTFPQFFVEDINGNPDHSGKLKGKIALYMFYRGNWCPLCMSQIREIAASYQELAKRGVEIALISPQSHENTQKLAKQYNVPFHFWVDTENKVAQMLGIEEKSGVVMGYPGYEPDTVFPTVVITNEDSEIIFVHETDNYRIRPEPKTFLDILDTYLANKATASA